MTKLSAALVLGLCGAVLAGCVVSPHLRPVERPATSHARVHKAGPPPHAPAHGYRHKRRSGVELVFDSSVGVYVVVGHPNHYFHSGHYFRRVGGVWHISAALDRGWTTVATKKVPKRLLKKHAKERQGRVPAKHRQ